MLYKGDNLKQINYNIAPLRFSDHRPVYATFECIVNIIDESKKQTLYQEIYHNRRSEVIDVVTKAKPDIAEDEELHGYKSIAPGLPPASSARQRWWLANGILSNVLLVLQVLISFRHAGNVYHRRRSQRLPNKF